MSEEKQRILLLERVNRTHFNSNLCVTLYGQDVCGCTQLFNHSLFQTLHMKEEENKRLSQRLVSYLSSLRAMEHLLH